ncbi:unnamed protein product [Linum trigynum]|uniref:Uncharacterized protein n=1 Tax=Linum trigynum TaxID=586398 RepID=A0AAV2DWU1_9ROSI
MDRLDDDNDNGGVDFNLGKSQPPRRSSFPNDDWFEELGILDQPAKKLGSPSKAFWKLLLEEWFMMKLGSHSIHSNPKSSCSPQPVSAVDNSDDNGGGGEIMVFFTKMSPRDLDVDACNSHVGTCAYMSFDRFYLDSLLLPG